MRIKVLEIISDTNIGGAGRLLLTRLAESDREKFDIGVVLPVGSELIGEFRKIGCDPYTVRNIGDRSFDARAVVELLQLFRKDPPHIINAHGCLSARIAAAVCGIPVRVYTRHCAFRQSMILTHFPVKNIIGGLSRCLSTHIIAVADAAADNLIETGVRREQISVIINGVKPVKRYSAEEKRKTRKDLGINENAFVCGICARLEDYKGIDTLLRAARILLNENDNYFFMIVGKGSAMGELVSLRDALGLKKNVRFFGFASDITPYINCFDLNINCSRGTETSSLALSEGMSIGLPCVASDWGGNPYMVRDGYNGFIYRTNNFSQLAECIRMLREDKVTYNKMSENAFLRYSEELGAKEMTRKTEELYSSLFLAKMKTINHRCQSN